MSKFVKHIPCEKCGSSDGNSLYEDGHTYCFVCEHRTNGTNLERPRDPGGSYNTGLGLADRGISSATTKKYGVGAVIREGQVVSHHYPYHDKNGHQVSSKTRIVLGKKFFFDGNVSAATLFGQHLFPAGSSKSITLVEGECDALAAFELLGSKYPVVSLVTGSGGAVKDVAANFEYLNSFPEIVVCFDKDEAKISPDGSVKYPGQEAALAVANMFESGKVRVLTLARGKDPNEYLINKFNKEFVDEWWKAPKHIQSGLKYGSDLWKEISEPKNYETVNYPWDGLNKLTYGLRLSELVTITADSGIGKTALLREMAKFILDQTEEKKYGVGLLFFEETNRDTGLGLMSIEANKPLHLPDVAASVDKRELKALFDKVLNNERVVIWDHFGSNSIHEVLSKVRHMHNLGCKYIILDHLSIVVSDQSGDERKQLDEITTKLKTLCMELDIAIVVVVHTNRQGQIRGTAGVEQLSNMVIRLHRDKEDPDPWRRNITKVVIQKNRFSGQTGPACYLHYQQETGRLVELDPESAKLYENGHSAQQIEEAPW